jgi:SAM-dependent methyltransferase
MIKKDKKKMYDPKKYWEARGMDYKVSDDTSAELENLRKLIFSFGDFEGIVSRNTFLEIGSGYGRLFQSLSETVYKDLFWMCDISQSMIDKCFHNTGIMPNLWDGVTLPYDDNFFDWVISFSLLLHVPHNNINQIFKEHIRVCKKYIFIATYSHGLKRLAEHCFQHDYKALINDSNLKIIDEKYFQQGNALRVNYLLRI